MVGPRGEPGPGAASVTAQPGSADVLLSRPGWKDVLPTSGSPKRPRSCPPRSLAQQRSPTRMSRPGRPNPEAAAQAQRERSGMASQAKKRALGSLYPRAPGARAEGEHEEAAEDTDESGDESGDSDEEEEEEEDEFINQEVTVDFEAHAISSGDSDGIQKLLRQLFLKAPVNLAELAGLLAQQTHVGSVIKQTDVPEESDEEDGEEEIFGFISLLNLTERKGTGCAEQIKELVLSLCEKNCEQSVVEQLDKLFNDPSKPVGFLLSERFINVPPQIALPMHQQLQKELVAARQANQPCGKCHYYLMISKTFQEASGRARNKGSVPRKGELMFANAEEEFFYEKALLKFSYSVQEESDLALGGRWSFDDLPMKPLRTVMLIPASKMSAVMETLKEYLSV
ncbi:BRCA2 and CDKN1A-interacting protein isoform X1 [Dromiciops gliroides]|uniref:BRCA2 and CDKN1A-interacting protein isoform X1 n=1 Tax=Dromiciops gliroides TaxID=33562 RepID=UPI001CC7D87C|nr:BRCA2 and CDKN1A-interacting protein isoform X1 [Dromiciops gliroides]